jgi:general secretion pathway protein G
MKKATRIVKFSKQAGFTLVELLIVVIILAVLAAIVVPQFSTSTQEAREAALKSTLLEMRNAIELYYHQHNGKYPGHTLVTTGTGVNTTAAGFTDQLVLYTDINGKTGNSKDLTATPPIKYGPYLKSSALPVNPIDDSNAVNLVDYNTGGDLSQPAAVVGTNGGWWFDAKSGKFVANTAGQASDGTNFIDW